MNSNVKKAAAIAAVIVLAAAAVMTVIFGPFRKTDIADFEIVTVRESGMHASAEYEIVRDGDNAVVSMYTIPYTGDENERHLEMTAVISASEAMDKMTEVGLLGWDGFHGAHPRNVSDGTMFTLDAVVNGGKKVHADGSQNFPRHYREFVQWIMGILYNDFIGG